MMIVRDPENPVSSSGPFCPRRLRRQLMGARHLAGRMEANGDGAPSPDFLYDVAVQSLADRIALIGRPIKTILVISCGLRDLSLIHAVRGVLGASVDIHVLPPFFHGTAAAQVQDPFCWSANGFMPVSPETYDLVLSFFPWPLVQDPLMMGRCAYEALKADRPFLGVLLGGDSLSPLRDALYGADMAVYGGAYGRIHPMMGASGIFHLLTAAGFDTPIVDVDKLKAHYPHVRGLARDLRLHGMGCALLGSGANPGGAAFWREVDEQLCHPSPTHPLIIPYDLIYFSAWRP